MQVVWPFSLALAGWSEQSSHHIHQTGKLTAVPPGGMNQVFWDLSLLA